LSLVETFAEFESSLRPIIAYLPADVATRLTSFGKREFVKKFTVDVPKEKVSFSKEYSVKLWDIWFNAPIFNAAGMFKRGYGYHLVARQGAGAFLAGTTTYYKRKGNNKHGIKTPFLPFPRSEAAVNWLGLPNESHEVIAQRLSKIERVKGCPIGVSLSYDAGDTKEVALKNMVLGLQIYERAGVDFIEINESCPNVEGKTVDNNLEQALIDRLEYISKNFVAGLGRNLPVIVKLSNDTNINQVEDVVKLLAELNYSGVNFGNTSTRYKDLESFINMKEKHHYYYFYNNFGGGVSGEPLKMTSLELSQKAQRVVEHISPSKEFHVIRTGGISSSADLDQSQQAGIQLNQWYTGYFKNFGLYGHNLYKRLLD
jgi:dihydroorotate dehydrogenase